MSRQLFLMADRTFVEKRDSQLLWKQERPRPENVILTDDKPWEKSMAYFNVMTIAPGKYRLYYRADHHGPNGLGECICCAESSDGISWEKPELGLFLYEGSSANNITIGGNTTKFPATEKFTGDLKKDLRWRGDVAPFVDPTCPEGAPDRFKALFRGNRGACQKASECYDLGMYPAVSPDGLNWRVLTEKPVITRGKFDSLNLAVYDPVRKRYAAFTRDFKNGIQDPDDPEVWSGLVCRDVRVSFSEDFIHWSDPEYLKYSDFEFMQLYTNGVTVYEPEPKYFIGLMTMFHEDTGQTEPGLMISNNGGSVFFRWPIGVIPVDCPSERDGNRSNYFGQGMIMPNDKEIYVYAYEGYHSSPERRIRRFVWRRDGFASIAGCGSLITKNLDWQGGEAFINFSGKLSVTSLDSDGKCRGRAVVEGDCVSEKILLPPAAKLQFDLENGKLYSFALE